MPETVSTQEINKDVCDAVRTTGARYAIWDSEMKGFGLRVSAKGVRTFVVRYRVGGGRTGLERMHTIGRYGALTPKEARKRAKLALADVAAGGDPQGGRAKSRAEMTFADLCDLYVAEGCATKKASTLATDKGRIERHIKPLLGRKRVSEIDRADVERFLSAVAAGKTATTEKTKARGKAVVTGGKGTATRTLGLVGAILGFAVARKLRKDNPAHGVKRFTDRRCERFLSPAEMGRLGETLEAMEAEGFHPYALAQIRLLAFTGARRSEIASLKWREIDLARGVLRLETSKTGQKVLTLSPGAASILAGVTPVADSLFVFPAGQRAPRRKAKKKPGEESTENAEATADKKAKVETERHYQGVAKVWETARARAKLSDVRLHDLRHTFASFGAGGGFGLPVIGALLGHRHAATTARYAHLADDPLRKANDWIGEEIGAALNRRAASA